MAQEIDMHKIVELTTWYKALNPGLDFYVKVLDPDDIWDDLLDLKQPIVTWSIDAFDPLSFNNHEYYVNGCHGCTTDEVIQRLNHDVNYFLSKEEVKFIIEQNRRAGGVV